IGDDEASVVAAIFLLNRNGVEMSGVYFGDEQGNIGIHAVIARIADDGIAGASEILLGRTCDGRIERGEDEVAVEREIETLDDEIASGFSGRRVDIPTGGFSVGLVGGALVGGNLG